MFFRMAKTIIDAILGLSFEDSPSNLAAAALFYVLTNDVSRKVHMFNIVRNAPLPFNHLLSTIDYILW